MAILDDILKQFQEAQDKANAANEQRYKDALELYNANVAMFSQGGQFSQNVEAQLGQARKASVAQGMQALVNAGLANTTTAAGLGKKFEEEVGVPFRAQAEDKRLEQLANARSAKAAFIERREDEGPDPALVAQLSAAASSAPEPMSFSAPSGSYGYTQLGFNNRQDDAYKRSVAEWEAQRQAEYDALDAEMKRRRAAQIAKERQEEEERKARLKASYERAMQKAKNYTRMSDEELLNAVELIPKS